MAKPGKLSAKRPMSPKALKARRSRPNKINLWFKYYTDETNPSTFLNKLGSAKAAGYKAKTENAFGCIGVQNYKKLQNQISKWTDETGLSESYLKQKLANLINADDTKLFAKREDGNLEIIEHKVPALGIQLKAVELAGRWKGMEKQAEGSGLVINIYPPDIGKIKSAGAGSSQGVITDGG